MLRPFSDRPRGLFVTVDGPSGAGKSTVVEHLAQLLVADGEEVHVTAEPSSGPIGGLCRELTETVTGHALACLYAAWQVGVGRTWHTSQPRAATAPAAGHTSRHPPGRIGSPTIPRCYGGYTTD